LAGLEHLQDLSTTAEPIEKDLAVARAWLQLAWADNSGVSRTLSALSQAEAEQLVQVLDQVSQPFIHREVMLSLARSGYLHFPIPARLTRRQPSGLSKLRFMVGTEIAP
jgi:hypothetical protein